MLILVYTERRRWRSCNKINFLGLVTFWWNKYMTAETFKTGSGTQENGNEMYTSNLRYIFNISSIWDESVFSTIFVPVLRVFSRFTCKHRGFWVIFINIGHIHGQKRQLPHDMWSWKFYSDFHLIWKLQIRCQIDYNTCSTVMM